MNIITVGLSIFFTLLSSAIISHISMVTPLGPWIAPTIVLVVGTLFRWTKGSKMTEKTNQDIVLIQTAGSVGGALAMGIGFTLPMLYFLDSAQFNQWLAHPIYFCVIIASVCLTAGGFGILLARLYASKLIDQEELPFPVSDLIYKTIICQTQMRQAKSMFLGFFSGTMLTILRDGIFGFTSLTRGIFHMLAGICGANQAFFIQPMVWSMGFIAGMSIVFPLLIGFFARYLVLYPFNYHSQYLPFKLFSPLPDARFAMAFCSGLVSMSIIFVLFKYLVMIWDAVKRYSRYDVLHALKNRHTLFQDSDKKMTNNNGYVALRKMIMNNLELLAVLFASVVFLSYFQFNLLAQSVMIGLIIIYSYQISYFSGKVGLVPFGRFTTFVMLPFLILFRLNYTQLTVLCLFSNICFGAATDLLFDYKVGQLSGTAFNRVYKYQWLGLIVTSLAIGLVLWLLFTTFTIGSPELFAHRARARALLIQSLSFDLEPVFCGLLFGFILKHFKLNPMMVFGGILMPPAITIGLMIGACISFLDSKAKDHVPFWSGVFAGESTCVIINLLICMLA